MKVLPSTLSKIHILVFGISLLAVVAFIYDLGFVQPASRLHETILEAMQVDEIVHPEEETAERWSKKLNIRGVLDSFEVTGEYSIIEARVPDQYAGLTLAEAGLNKKYNVVVLTTIKMHEEKNLIGVTRKVPRVQGTATSETILGRGDVMILYGKLSDIQQLLKA